MKERGTSHAKLIRLRFAALADRNTKTCKLPNKRAPGSLSGAWSKIDITSSCC